MPFSLTRIKVFDTVMNPRTGAREERLVEEHPTIRLFANGQSLWIQDGQVWSEGGQAVPDPPEWFWEQLALVDPSTLAATGWTGPSMPQESQRDGKSKTCPVCAVEVTDKHWNRHCASKGHQMALAETQEHEDDLTPA